MNEPSTIDASAIAHGAVLQYRAADLLIDVGRQRVIRGDAVIALPKLSFDLLIALVRAAPNLASTDALMEQVWPKAVVNPETVSQRVKLLRDALGDDPRHPRYVESLRGRGYRLIPSVEVHAETPHAQPMPQVPPAPAVAAVDATPPAPPTRIRLAVAPWLVTFAAVLLALAAGLWMLRRASPTQPAKSVAVVAMQPRSVAVLPFDNRGAAPGDDYLADGVADAIQHQLAGNPDLLVIARSSSFALGRPAPDAREAGRRLGVRYVVEGSVQRAGGTVRVTAQLIDTQTDRTLWSLQADRSLAAIFELQDRIAAQIARKFDATLHARSAEYARYGTDAYIAFLQGRASIGTRTIAGVEASIRQFSRAVELAPSFAAALAELARAKLLLAELRGADRGVTGGHWSEIEPLVRRAIEIDPRAGEPYFLRAQYRLDVAHDRDGAEADFRNGLDLAPNFGPGLRLYASYLYDGGRIDRALAAVDRARLVDPFAAENHYLKGEIVRTSLGGTEEAVALYLQALAVAPNFYPAYARLAQVRADEGRLAEAIRYAEKAVAIEPKIDWPRDRLLWLYVDAGDLPAARDVWHGYPTASPDRAASAALICYRAGYLDLAERWIRSIPYDPTSDANGLAYRLATDAVVERAIERRDAAGARRFIVSMPGLATEGASLGMVARNFPAIVQLATLESLAGDRAAGNALAERILDFVDHGGNLGLVGEDEWTRATALALLGRNAAALSHLEKFVKLSRLGWWGRVEHNPAFAALRGTPRFQAIEADERSWLAGQRRALTAMRSGGEVPTRAATAAASDPC